MAEFVDNLSLSEDERSKLKALGVSSPLGVLSIRKASPAAFDQHFGAERAQAISDQLKALLTPSELALLEQPSLPGGRLGARLTPAPDSKKSK
jgi:hypothetical protein